MAPATGVTRLTAVPDVKHTPTIPKTFSRQVKTTRKLDSPYYLHYKHSNTSKML